MQVFEIGPLLKRHNNTYIEPELHFKWTLELPQLVNDIPNSILILNGQRLGGNHKAEQKRA